MIMIINMGEAKAYTPNKHVPEQLRLVIVGSSIVSFKLASS